MAKDLPMAPVHGRKSDMLRLCVSKWVYTGSEIRQRLRMQEMQKFAVEHFGRAIVLIE